MYFDDAGCYRTNPFALAAWLHVALVGIHPFVDGNGRVTRIVASLPLVLSGYPPISIPSDIDSKRRYFQALQTAQSNQNLEPLADVFADGMIHAMNYIENLGPAAGEEGHFHFSTEG